MTEGPGSRAERRSIGLSASVLAAVLWGFGGIFVALTYAPGLLLTFYRLWVGAAMLTITLYSTRRRLSGRLLRASWLGGVLLAGDMATFYCAIKETSVVDVTLIGAFQPALVMLVSRRLFHERISRRDVLWIALAMAGVVLAVAGPGGTGHHKLLGDTLAAGSLLSFSAYWLASKHARQATGALEYTTGVTVVAALVLTVVLLISRESLGQVRAGDWWWIVLLVAIPGSGHLVMNWAHRFVDASISSAISCLSPLISAVVAIPILGQPLTLLQVVGVLVGVVAIAAIAVRQRQPLESPLE